MEMWAVGQCRRAWGGGLWAALVSAGQRVRGACMGETSVVMAWGGGLWGSCVEREHGEVVCGREVRAWGTSGCEAV